MIRKTTARARYLTPKEIEVLANSLDEMMQEIEDAFGCLSTGLRALRIQDPNRAASVIERAKRKLENTLNALHNLR